MLRLMTLLLATTTLFAGEVQLDMDQSWIKAKARATGHSFEAAPSQFQCHVSLDGDGRMEAATFSCSVADLFTGKEKRDEEMWHWFESETYPDIRFEMREFREEAGKKVMVGELKMHDVSQTLVIPVSVENQAGKVSIRGEVEIDTTNYNLPIIRKMGLLKVKPQVVITFELQGHV